MINSSAGYLKRFSEQSAGEKRIKKIKRDCFYVGK